MSVSAPDGRDGAADPLPDSQRDQGPSLLHRIEEGLLTLLMAVLLGLAFSQILLRNFFGITWLWAEPAVRHLVVWASLTGAVIAVRTGSHIRIDAVLRLLPPVWRRAGAALGDGIAAGVCLLLSWVAVRFVADERTWGSTAFLDVPGWILETIFPLVFAGMGLRFGRRALRGAVDTARRRGA